MGRGFGSQTECGRRHKLAPLPSQIARPKLDYNLYKDRRKVGGITETFQEAKTTETQLFYVLFKNP